MPTLNINGNIRTNTAAGWAADATVYTAKTILVTTDATYGATDQRKFKIADGTQTWSNLDYFPVSGYDDATSSIQTQLNAKEPTITTLSIAKGGTNSGTALNNGRVMISSAGAIIEGDTATYPSATELAYVKGVTSAIQTQLDNKLASTDYFHTTNLSVADSTSYYIGQSTAAGATVNSIPHIPLKAGKVTKVTTEVFSASTIGSNENGTLEFFYNDGANSTVISNTFKVDANRHAFVEFSGLDVDVNAGNSYFVYTSPALSTNPTSIQFRFNVYMR